MTRSDSVTTAAGVLVATQAPSVLAWVHMQQHLVRVVDQAAEDLASKCNAPAFAAICWVGGDLCAVLVPTAQPSIGMAGDNTMIGSRTGSFWEFSSALSSLPSSTLSNSHTFPHGQGDVHKLLSYLILSDSC